MATRYPHGYSNELLSLDELRARHEGKMHPEYARRIFACIAAADGLVGIGNSWRSSETQAANHRRSPNTFAPPGLSFHESHTTASGVVGCMAIDSVGVDGRHDEAWNWMRDNAGRFGLHTFWNVNGEPWHTQCVELANGVSTWNAAGRPDPSPLPLDGASNRSSNRASNLAPSTAAASGPDFGLYPFNDDKPTIELGWHGDLVTYAQRVVYHRGGGNIDIDGDFGPQTDSRIKDLQAFFGLPDSGIVDWSGTWQVVDLLAGNERDDRARAEAAEVIERSVRKGYYWVRRGDSPWAVAQRVYGSGGQATLLDPCDPAEPGFFAADHHIRLPNVSGRTTTVLPGESALAIVRRLYPSRRPSELLARFVELNGGEHRVLRPGDLVFLDGSSSP